MKNNINNMNINDFSKYNLMDLKYINENYYNKNYNKSIIYFIKDIINNITFIDYGYMPDLDERIDYLGLQYTISITHELSAEIVIFLHNLKLLYKTLETVDDISNINTFDMKNLDFDYVVISSNANVKITRRKVKAITKFHPYIRELIPSPKCFENNELCTNIIDEVNKRKHIII